MKTRFLTAILAAAMGVQGVCAAPTNMPPQDLVGMSINTNTLAISGVNSNTWPQIQASNNIAKATVVTVVSNEVDALQAKEAAWDQAAVDGAAATTSVAAVTLDLVAGRSGETTNSITLINRELLAGASPMFGFIHHTVSGWVTNFVYADAGNGLIIYRYSPIGDSARRIVENGAADAGTLFGSGTVPLTYLPGLWDAAALTNVLALARVPHVTTLSGSTSAVPTAAAVSNRIDRINRLVYQARYAGLSVQNIPDVTGTNAIYDTIDYDLYGGGDSHGFYHFDTNHVGRSYEIVTSTTASSGGGSMCDVFLVRNLWGIPELLAGGSGYGLDQSVQLRHTTTVTNGEYVGVFVSIDSGSSSGNFSSLFAPALLANVSATNATMLQIFERQ